MKRALCVLSVALLALVSCSKDNDSVVTPGDKVITDPIVKKEDSIVLPPILVQKIISTDQYGTLNNIVLYDGNKLKSIMDEEGNSLKYTYTGDLITKSETIYNGKLIATNEYTYNNGKLSMTIQKQPGRDFYYIKKYTHNTDTTAAYAKFKVTIATGIEEETGTIGKYTYRNGNLVKEEEFINGLESITINKFDTNNNPFKNAAGFNLLLGDENTGVNNIIESKSTSGSGSNPKPNNIAYVYKYDSNKYPTERILTYQGLSSVVTITEQYVY
ncbi:hypothetical protein [Flavobacterium hercynium]|uniref:DUF4595 domain-containing protein n=1 Tax=Flavobacterium hercynium TaxID=387094 RepID=A0A226HIP4_9FLAO|nr:hypothetical protein [Flavobacterium hercynium]OXA93974.1 hypothetical protein B0A66_05595 [Flavobacterium hercynium]SMP36617.1 hypothetical protein SAMN06265346_12314 [Flavobacterium hercynium]